MKLIYCGSCGDFVALAKRIRSCSCGKTKALYVDNGFGIYEGHRSFGIGIENPSFMKSAIDVKRYKRLTTKEKNATKRKKKMYHQAFQHSHFCAYAMVRQETLICVKRITKKEIERVQAMSKQYQIDNGVKF